MSTRGQSGFNKIWHILGLEEFTPGSVGEGYKPEHVSCSGMSSRREGHYTKGLARMEPRWQC